MIRHRKVSEVQNFALTKPCWIRHHQHKRRSPRTHTHTDASKSRCPYLSLARSHSLTREQEAAATPRPKGRPHCLGVFGARNSLQGCFPTYQESRPFQALSLSLSFFLSSGLRAGEVPLPARSKAPPLVAEGRVRRTRATEADIVIPPLRTQHQGKNPPNASK